MLGLIEFEHSRTHERGGVEPEWTPGEIVDECVRGCFTFGRRCTSDCDEWDVEVADWCDTPVRRTAGRKQLGSKNFMPFENPNEGPTERVDVERTAQPVGVRHVVRGVSRQQLFEKPQTLLRVRQL